MSTMLRIDASSRANGSVSRQIGDYFEAAWLGQNPGDRVLRRDLALSVIPHIAERTIAGFYTPSDQFTPELGAATALSDRLIAEVQSADTLLLTVPMYNFSIPSALKAWLDQIVRIGRTFAYDGASFTGLLTVKRAYIVTAHGAEGYANGGPLASADFLTPYLTFLLNFLGVSDVTSFSVQATTSDDPTVVSTQIERAKRQIAAAIAAGGLSEAA